MRDITDKENVFGQIMTKDELIRFSMFYDIHIANDSFIVTNDNNVIIRQKRPTSPLWIYIKNNLSDDERE